MHLLLVRLVIAPAFDARGTAPRVLGRTACAVVFRRFLFGHLRRRQRRERLDGIGVNRRTRIAHSKLASRRGLPGPGHTLVLSPVYFPLKLACDKVQNFLGLFGERVHLAAELDEERTAFEHHAQAKLLGVVNTLDRGDDAIDVFPLATAHKTNSLGGTGKKPHCAPGGGGYFLHRTRRARILGRTGHIQGREPVRRAHRHFLNLEVTVAVRVSVHLYVFVTVDVCIRTNPWGQLEI